MRLFHKKLVILFGFAAAFFLALISPALASAATTLSLVAPTSSVPIGSTFSVEALVNTDEPLNAYAITVGASGSGSVRFVNANNAGSLITVWQNMPAAAADGEVSWNGGSLMPFAGTGGKLMTLNFTATATGTVTFSFGDSYVYLANGKGTKVVPREEGASVTVAGAAEGNIPQVSSSGSAIDTTPPAITYLSIVKDPFNANQKLLAFAVADAGSGVKETDMRYRSGFFWSDWQKIQNPAPLGNDVWEVDFRVTDNAGNVAERTLYDWVALTWTLGVTAAIVVVGLGALAWFFRRRRRREMVE